MTFESCRTSEDGEPRRITLSSPTDSASGSSARLEPLVDDGSARRFLVTDHFWSRPGIVPYRRVPIQVYVHPYEVGTIYVDDNGAKTTLFKWPKNLFTMRQGEYEPALQRLRDVLAALPPEMQGPR